MKIGCHCGNVIRDNTDCIPYKAYFIADQDIFDLLDRIAGEMERAWNERDLVSPTSTPRALASEVAHSVVFSYTRRQYQCSNCGRICTQDPDDPRQLQWFTPQDANWKKSFVSIKGEDSKAWHTNLVGHWEPSRSTGRLWYDPSVGQRGGFETFTDWTSLQNRYLALFEQFKSEERLAGARLGVGNEGEAIQDVHSWSSRT